MSREDVAVIIVTHSPIVGTTRGNCLSALRRRPTIQPSTLGTRDVGLPQPTITGNLDDLMTG